MFYAAGFTVGPDGRSVISAQNTVLNEPLRKHLAHQVTAARKANNAFARAEGCPCEDYVIMQLMLASGARPHLSDAQIETAAALRRNDQESLRNVAGGDVCPMCTRAIGPHHPLQCRTINHRGAAHDNLVNKLARAIGKNPALSVSANKAIKTGRARRDAKFRPDVEVQETNQLVEVKTLNADTHGKNLAKAMFVAARKAHVKYLREVKRSPLVIVTSVDGYVAAEGFAALTSLTDTTSVDMPVCAPRLSLIAGFALCEAAAGAYEAWHWQVGCTGAGAGGT